MLQKTNRLINGKYQPSNRIGATLPYFTIADKMSLNAKILTDREDYEKLQKEAGVKMEKIRKKASEVFEPS